MEELNYTDLYGLRVLVFMEIEPQSNKYCQVLLSPQMYKNMTATLAHKTGNKLSDGMDEMTIKAGEKEYELDDIPEACSNYDEL